MQCLNCHQEIPQPSAICPHCGTPQKGVVEEQVVPASPALLQIFAQSASLMLTHLGTLAPIILAVALPVQLARSFLIFQTELLQRPGLALIVQYGTELPFHALIEPAFFMALFALPTGRHLTVIDAYREALHWWPRMFGVYVKLWALTMLGFMLFIVPALWIMMIFAFVDLVALLDPDRSQNPFTTSGKLVSGHQVRILTVVLLQVLVSFGIERVLNLDREVIHVWWVNALLGSGFAVLVRWFSTVLLLFYVRVRLARGEYVPTFDDLFPRLAHRYSIVPEA